MDFEHLISEDDRPARQMRSDAVLRKPLLNDLPRAFERALSCHNNAVAPDPSGKHGQWTVSLLLPHLGVNVIPRTIRVVADPDHHVATISRHGNVGIPVSS